MLLLASRWRQAVPIKVVHVEAAVKYYVHSHGNLEKYTGMVTFQLHQYIYRVTAEIVTFLLPSHTVTLCHLPQQLSLLKKISLALTEYYWCNVNVRVLSIGLSRGCLICDL